MMGRQRLEELKRRARVLSGDGHREGAELAELAQECERLRRQEWTSERLHDALDTIAALYLTDRVLNRKKGLSDTSVLELIEWSGDRLAQLAIFHHDKGRG